LNIKNYVYGDWGLGIGDWGLGIGDWAQSPIPNYNFLLLFIHLIFIPIKIIIKIIIYIIVIFKQN